MRRIVIEFAARDRRTLIRVFVCRSLLDGGAKTKISKSRANYRNEYHQQNKTKLKSGAVMVLFFGFGALSTSKSYPKWSPGVPKSSPGAPNGAVGETPANSGDLGRPKVPFWNDFGSILGAILESFLVFFGS